MNPQHYLGPDSVSLDEARALIARAAELKAGAACNELAGRSAGLLFFNPSNSVVNIFLLKT